MARDINAIEFDDATLTKLALYEGYLKEWLPVFTDRRELLWKRIQIFDFFAGSGTDCTGREGSPLLLLRALRSKLGIITSRGIELRVTFNDASQRKITDLRALVSEVWPATPSVRIEFSNADFRTAFDNVRPQFEGAANLLFLDQYGVKEIDGSVLEALMTVKTTDFLFFISSSTLHRFSEHPAIKSKIDLSEIRSASDYFSIHREVLSYFRSLIPRESELRLAPFSIKKGSNIYGLIFGSSHILGVEKFLRVAWALDAHRGEANFDIDREGIRDESPFLLAEMNKPKKTGLFEERLRDEIKGARLQTTADLYSFCIEEGFLPRHARPALAQLVKDGVLRSLPTGLDHKTLREPKRLDFGKR